MSSVPAKGGAPPAIPPAPRFRVALYGGGVEEVDAPELRRRIRGREIVRSTEIAPADTEDWRPAAAYPELVRFLDAMEATVKQTARPAVVKGAMGDQVVQGLAMPFRGSFLTILGVALFGSIPFIGLLSIPVVTVYSLAIVRNSAAGNTEMPHWFETDDVVGNMIVWLKACFVTVVALWPVALWLYVWSSTTDDKLSADGVFTLIVGMAVAGVVSMLYYPACFATMAVWDSVLDSLNPVYVWRVIKTIGSDYLIVVGMYVVATGAAAVVGFLLKMLMTQIPIPIIGSIPGRLPAIWSIFYASHLLGWAVYRHADELGWE